jgi:hypothetical protein
MPINVPLATLIVTPRFTPTFTPTLTQTPPLSTPVGTFSANLTPSTPQIVTPGYIDPPPDVTVLPPFLPPGGDPPVMINPSPTPRPPVNLDPPPGF